MTGVPSTPTGLALRTLARYAAPLVLLSALVFAPLALHALRAEAPRDAAAATRLLVWSFAVAGTAWILQLVLVGAVAPAVRAVAAGERVSQLRVLGRGLLHGVRMALPIAVVGAAVFVGGLALVVPGLALLVLLSLTGASSEPGMPGPLLDSVAVARANLRPVATVVLVMLVVDVALAGGAYLVLAGSLPKKPTPEQLGAYRTVARVTALGLVAVSPLAATLLAAIRARATAT